MKWVLSHATDELHHWQLQQAEGSRSLSVNLQRLSLRLTGFSRRLFFLQVQGFLQKKILLRSEYGVAIGETSFADKPTSSPVIFNGQKFFYQLEEEKLKLLDAEKTPIGETELALSQTIDRTEFYALLFGFCWFLTADAVADKSRLLTETA